MGWWTFDDGSGTEPVDISSYGRHGEFVGSPQWVDEGHAGGALNITLDSYVVIPGYKGILGSSSRTCTAWIKTVTAPAVVFGWGLITPGTKWIVRINDGGQLRCEVDSGYHYGHVLAHKSTVLVLAAEAPEPDPSVAPECEVEVELGGYLHYVGEVHDSGRCRTALI